jgi:hypothetical protein
VLRNVTSKDQSKIKSISFLVIGSINAFIFFLSPLKTIISKPTIHKSHPKYRNTGPQGSKKTENKKPTSIREIEGN